MQKLYQKIKDHWFFVLGLIFITWFLQKLFDYLLGRKNVIFHRIFQVINYKINIAIVPFIFGVFTPAIIYRIYRYYKYKKNKLRILDATYGIDSKFINITNELNKAVIDNKLKIILSNNIAGDPHKGKVKKGKIKYSFNDKESEKEFSENDLIDLP
jgi:hypothetical protein